MVTSPFLLDLTAHHKPHPFVPGVELGVLCARQDLCQSLHLHSLTIEPLTAHRTACGGAPTRRSDGKGKGSDCRCRLLALSLARDGLAGKVRPPLRVRTHCARLWTHSPLPRRSRYRTQALPEAPPPSDLTHLPLSVVQRGQLRGCVSRSGYLGALQGRVRGKGMSPGVAHVGHFSD